MLDVEAQQRFRRQIRAMLALAGDDDPEGFAFVVKLLDEAASDGVRAAAAKLRSEQGDGQPGYSWAELAAPLGVCRSAAAQRFRARV